MNDRHAEIDDLLLRRATEGLSGTEAERLRELLDEHGFADSDDYELAAQHLFTAAQAVTQDPDVQPEAATAQRESYFAGIEEALRTAVRAGFGEQAKKMTSDAPFAEPRFQAAAQPTSSDR